MLTADGLTAALEKVTLTDGATVAVNWKAGFVYHLTMAGNRTLANPTNVVPGSTIIIEIYGNDATAFNNIDAKHDLEIVEGPLDVLDHSSPMAKWGAKLGVDATKTWPEEGHSREWPDEIAMSEDIKAKVDAKWKERGLE